MKPRALPTVARMRPFVPPSFERARLSNGLDVVVAEKAGLPVIDVQLVVRGGAAVDPPALAGRASLTAELLDEGSLHRSALEISDCIEQLGAHLDLQVSWDACALTVHGLVPRLAAMLDLLAEVALEPAFPAHEFTRKKEERLHRLQQERAEPRVVASKALARAVFGAQQSYGCPLSGSTATIAQLGRESLVDSYTNHFAPARAHLIVVGPIDAQRIMSELEQRFGAWSAVPGAQPRVQGAPPRTRTIYLIDRPGAAQSEVRVGHVGLPRNTPDYFPALIMNTVLGGSFKSRLNMILRAEKGFTYGAGSSFSFRREGGLFSSGAAVFTHNTAESVAIFVRELARLRQDGVRTDEIERSRRYHALGFARAFETTRDITEQLAELALYDLDETQLQTYTDRIASVDQSDIERVARQCLRPEELSIVVVGDRVRVLEPLRQLELGPILEWEAE
ncbi:MAG: M16 family metallopeptidase [Longimicrobiales bacterium]